MVSLRIIITVLCATLLVKFSLARPRTPALQSPRFPQFSDNSVGEFVLWSCTATAQLQKNNNLSKTIIHIEPAAVDVPETAGVRVPFNQPSRESDDDQINNIRIIKINAIPHQNRERPEGVPKKSTLRNGEKTASDQEIKHKNVLHPATIDSPLKTIKVNSFGNNMPILFREKPLLPEIEDGPNEGDEKLQHSSKITVIKPYDNDEK